MQRFHYSFGKVLISHVLFVAAVIILLLSFEAKAFPDRATEHSKIVYLLDAISSSNLVFIRNGAEYNGEEARAHLQDKLDVAGDRILTAEDFINYIASESLITGMPYMVRLADGTQMEAGVWLRNRLAEIK
jgi:hypothetical protein